DEKHTVVPSIVYPADTRRDDFYTRSAVTAEAADHIRLHYVNVSYNIYGKQLLKTPIQSVEITAFANNLGVIWAKNTADLDPDYPDRLHQKTFSLGVKVSF